MKNLLKSFHRYFATVSVLAFALLLIHFLFMAQGIFMISKYGLSKLSGIVLIAFFTNRLLYSLLLMIAAISGLLYLFIGKESGRRSKISIICHECLIFVLCFVAFSIISTYLATSFPMGSLNFVTQAFYAFLYPCLLTYVIIRVGIFVLRKVRKV